MSFTEEKHNLINTKQEGLSPLFFQNLSYKNNKMNSKQPSQRDSKGLIPAYGGELKDLIIKDEKIKSKLLSQVSYELECSDRNACDIELLMVGGFSPLEGFMDKEDYKSVIKSHRNKKGLLFGLPIVFDTNNATN